VQARSSLHRGASRSCVRRLGVHQLRVRRRRVRTCAETIWRSVRAGHAMPQHGLDM